MTRSNVHGLTSPAPSAASRNENLRREAGGLLILAGHPSLEVRYGSLLYQVNGRSSKAPSRHTSAIHSLNLPRYFNHEIQLRTADFIVVFQADVGFGHQPSEGGQICFLERGGSVTYPGIFGNDVTTSLVNGLRQIAAVTIQVLDTDIPQRT